MAAHDVLDQPRPLWNYGVLQNHAALRDALAFNAPGLDASTLGQEAMECLGGNGCMEEAGHGAVLHVCRRMPVNPVGAGAGSTGAIELRCAWRKLGADLDAIVARAMPQ